MSTVPRGNFLELRGLVQQMCDGEATFAIGRRIEELVRGDHQAREWYVNYLWLHADLHWSVARRPSLELLQGSAAMGEIESMLGDRFKSVGLTRSPRRLRRFYYAAAACMCVVLISYFVGMALFVSSRDEPRRDLAQSEHGDSSGVASITAGFECEWDESGSPWQSFSRNAELVVGRQLSLKRGVAEITSRSGARLIVEGPTTFTIVSQDKCSIQQGRMIARVPHSAIGFVVETPEATIVDLGTEFGVAVDANGTTEVQVLEGAVAAKARELQPSQGDGLTLKRGQALRFTSRGANSERIVTSIAASEGRFVRDVPQQSAIPRSQQPRIAADAGRAASIARQTCELILKERPIVYYAMDAIEGDRLIDSGPGGHHGELRRANPWENPRSPGKVGSALRFGGAAARDYVVVRDFPISQTGEMTIIAWVFATNRPRWATIAANWGSGSSGQFLFGLYRDGGDFHSFIMQSDGKQGETREGEAFSLPIGRWQHLALVVDRKFIRLYRNGAEVGWKPCSGLATESPFSCLGIGCKLADRSDQPHPTAACFWEGLIDEFAMLDHLVSDDWINQLYRCTEK